jgi:hypothetical protein
LRDFFISRWSLLQNYQEVGIPGSDAPSGLWFVPTEKLFRERPVRTIFVGVPPPLFWMQNPCFHQLADRVSL